MLWVRVLFRGEMTRTARWPQVRLHRTHLKKERKNYVLEEGNEQDIKVATIKLSLEETLRLEHHGQVIDKATKSLNYINSFDMEKWTYIQRLQEGPVERALQDYYAGTRPRCLQDYELDFSCHPEPVAWHGDDLHDADHYGL